MIKLGVLARKYEGRIMSFSTTVYLTLNDGNKSALTAIRAEVAAYLTENALSQDVLEDVEQAFDVHGSTGPVMFNLEPWSIIALFTFVAEHIPSLSFDVKGVGDLGPGDIWTREFVNGVVAFEAGPFEEKIYC